MVLENDDFDKFKEEYNFLILNHELTKLERKLKRLTKENKKLNKEFKVLSNKNKSIINSKSWKITKPLRKIKSFLKS